MENDIVDRLEEYAADELENGVSSNAGKLCLAAANEIRTARTKLNVTNELVRMAFSKKFANSPFICGIDGLRDNNNMPQYFHITLAYGSDITYTYERKDSFTRNHAW